MAFEKVKLFSKIEVELASTVTGTFRVLTDVPGNTMAQRGLNINTPVATRRVISSRLPYNTQGHLIQASLIPNFGGAITLYGVRVWGRELPGGEWQWYPLPVIDTPIEFSAAQIPIPPTPEEWGGSSLPIPPTPEGWSSAALPIPPTPEGWSAAELPIKPTPAVPEWADLEVDA